MDIIQNIHNGDCLFDIKIKSLDPTGVEIQEWVIKVERILKVDFGFLDMSKVEFQKPYLILEPLDCILSY